MRISCIAVLTALALAAGTFPADAAETGKRDKSTTAAKKTKPRTATRTTSRAYVDGGVPRGPLYWGQDYLGDDPDPNIRSQILRDTGARFGGPE